MPLINCEINLILTWFDKCVLSNVAKATTLAVTDTKLYVPVLTLSTHNNAKMLEKLKSGFKITINYNKYQPKVTTKAPKLHLEFLIEPSFQEVNRIFVLSFENKDDRKIHKKYYLLTIKIKDYNVMIGGRNFFDQPVKNNLATYEKLQLVKKMITLLVVY